MAHYDITHRLARFFDRHMVLPLLEFINGKNIYDEESLLSGKQEVLESTKMVDYSADVYIIRFPDQKEAPQSMLDKRAEVLLQMKELEAEVESLVTIFRDNQTASVIKDGTQLVEYLEKNGYKMEAVYENLYNCAKFHYECGNYSRSSQYLYFLRTMLPPSNKNFMNALWGKLASDILMQDWDAAIEDIVKLKEILDNNPSPPLVLLQQRTWLIHWSLFVYFNHNKGHDFIIDLFLYNSHYLNAIQTMCPHILRYLTSAVITNRKRRQDHPQLIKDLVKVLVQESYTYKDPITEFVECLYVKFDFDGAQMKLKECEEVLSNDFFLVGCFNDFIENARLLIFETFCKIHSRTSISGLAEKLNMKKEEEAERWTANLINNTKLRAKIDSKQALLLIDSQPTNAYQQAVDKTKTYSMRTQAMVMNIDKKFAPKAENQWTD